MNHRDTEDTEEDRRKTERVKKDEPQRRGDAEKKKRRGRGRKEIGR
jgi:hypothetical protein